jgi:hypothetical protein
MYKLFINNRGNEKRVTSHVRIEKPKFSCHFLTEVGILSKSLYQNFDSELHMVLNLQ